jgi:hypothetical protein
MKLRRLIGMIVAVPLGGLAVVSLVVPLAAQNGRNGQVHIVKDCAAESGVPGSDFCTIVTSNLWQLPAGTRIYYDLSPGPTAGPGYFDNNIFVFVNTGQWAVGRCTGPNDIVTVGVGLCTLSDGVGPLAGFSARVSVTHTGSASDYAWDGTYSFNPLPGR